MRFMNAPVRRSRARCLVATTALLACLTTLLTVSPVVASATTQAPASATRTRGQDFPNLAPICHATKQTICRVTSFRKRPWLVLWGDSHALEYLAPIRKIAKQRRVNLVVIYSGACPLSLPFPASSGEPLLSCDKHNRDALKYVRRLSTPPHRQLRVILGSWWDLYRRQHRKIEIEAATGVPSDLTSYERHIARIGVERSTAFFKAVGRSGIAADVIAQSGAVPATAPPCSAGQEPYRCRLDRRLVLPRERDNRRWLARLSSHLRNRPIVIDPSPVYCNKTTCRGRVGGVNTFYDAPHLSQRLTLRMRRYFRPTFDALLSR